MIILYLADLFDKIGNKLQNFSKEIVYSYFPDSTPEKFQEYRDDIFREVWIEMLDRHIQIAREIKLIPRKEWAEGEVIFMDYIRNYY